MTYQQPQPDIGGWMSQRELEWLCERASRFPVVVEIGSWMGRSTHALCMGCPGTVYAVDHFKGSPSEINAAHARAKTENIRAIFDRNVGHFPNLRVLQMDSIEAAKSFGDRSVAMVFIDGDHSYGPFKADLEAWLPKCSILLCGHDINQDGVPRAIKEILGQVKVGPGSIWIYEICAH